MLPPDLQQQLAGIETRLEDCRRQLLADRRKTRAVSGASAAALVLLALLAWTLGFPGLGLSAALAAILPVGYLWYHSSSVAKSYQSAYKREIHAAILRHFSPDLRYDADRGITLAEFRSCQLFNDRIDRFRSQDLVSGIYGKTRLRFSRLHAEERHTERTNNGTRTYYTTIFEGILFIADFNKEFRGRTYVRTDHAERLFGNFGRFFQKLTFSAEKLVQLENPEFEKEFAVYTGDQVEARYILTPALMERLLAVKQRFQTETQFAFHDSTVTVAIAGHNLLSDPDFAKPAGDELQLENIYLRLRFFLGIVDDLDLNTRIWSKA
jgi:hypothetical protein